jgi:hypothetical protein
MYKELESCDSQGHNKEKAEQAKSIILLKSIRELKSG